MSLSGTALINYAMIKINKTDIYSKALEHRNAKCAADIIIWANFRSHVIEEYEKLLSEGG